MRLICGLLNLDGAKVSEELLDAMVAQMDVPRLRPSLRLWRDGPVGLGVLDFSTRGVHAGRYPKRRFDHGRRCAARRARCTRARVDGDTRRLRTLCCGEFVAPGRPASTGSRRFCFRELGQKRPAAGCGRDMFGIRPLAYVHKPGKLFAFASFPKALHGVASLRRKSTRMRWRAGWCGISDTTTA